VHSSSLQAAIVDLDGTLVDTLGDFDAALNLMLRELSLPAIERAAIASMIGKGSAHLVRSALAHAGAPPGLSQPAWASYQKHYLAINGRHSSLYPGAAECLRALQGAGLRLACLTNKPTSFAEPLLVAKGLRPFFDFVFGGDAFEASKPDPLPVLQTCRALGTVPGRTLMVGDSSNDAQAARGAGCPVVLVTYGYNHGQPVREVAADGFVDSLAELAGWLGAAGFAKVP
jgi:phosphoglycolate phosphatase